MTKYQVWSHSHSCQRHSNPSSSDRSRYRGTRPEKRRVGFQTWFRCLSFYGSYPSVQQLSTRRGRQDCLLCAQSSLSAAGFTLSAKSGHGLGDQSVRVKHRWSPGPLILQPVHAQRDADPKVWAKNLSVGGDSTIRELQSAKIKIITTTTRTSCLL